MARVTAYEASDGTLHRDKKAWQLHESNLLADKRLAAALVEVLPAEADASHRETIHHLLTKRIGLDRLRDILTTQFKPGAADDDASEPASGSAAAAASAQGAPDASTASTVAPDASAVAQVAAPVSQETEPAI